MSTADGIGNFKIFSRALRSMSKANDALQTRDHSKFGGWNAPGSAAHRFTLRRVRGKSS